jgi:hypothetical protein
MKSIYLEIIIKIKNHLNLYFYFDHIYLLNKPRILKKLQKNKFRNTMKHHDSQQKQNVLRVKFHRSLKHKFKIS